MYRHPRDLYNVRNLAAGCALWLLGITALCGLGWVVWHAG